MRLLLPIKQKFIEKIINGEKNTELRKFKPTLPCPFTVLIYECAAKDIEHADWYSYTGYDSMTDESLQQWDIRNGKVVGEFTCDRVDLIYYTDITTSDDYEEGYLMPSECEIGISGEELYKYGNTEDLYGLHISNLIIYNKPVELNNYIVAKTGKPLKRAPQNCCYVK